MNLQDQGYRFILREKDGRVDGYWEHPTGIKPGGFDATDLDDEELAQTIYAMQDGFTCPDCPATPAVCASVDCCVRWA